MKRAKKPRVSTIYRPTIMYRLEVWAQNGWTLWPRIEWSYKRRGKP